MAILEKEVSLRFDLVEKELKELKGMVASICINFLALGTSLSFENLLSHPPSPPYHDLEPPFSPISTSPTFASPSIPSTLSPTPPPTTSAVITVPQPTSSLPLLPISQTLSPISQLPSLPILITLPTISSPSLSSNANKKREKKKSA
ncbi:lysine-rich arabinogalactan protein 19-like [Neltuma alba]|uniref:lysine-rich arabinogalactan protein 19-like n=1 Tax=Neltuma alba TaxID=207710 RepID=UPI0010A3DCCD|nr:lysine-rich arabinogalactan protein 19-like [Prosopis alba]